MSSPSLIASLGHSGSHAAQLMQSDVMYVAMWRALLMLPGQVVLSRRICRVRVALCQTNQGSPGSRRKKGGSRLRVGPPERTVRANELATLPEMGLFVVRATRRPRRRGRVRSQDRRQVFGLDRLFGSGRPPLRSHAAG